MIVIVNYGLGNLGSIKNMLTKIGSKSIISSKPDAISRADKLILPGVGSFDRGMSNLEKLKLIPVINKKVIEEKTPILGICLGMQLMTKNSQEGKLKGLGWINADTIRFNKDDEKFIIPHMGWNNIILNKNHSILNNINRNSRFYFVHSYHVVCQNDSDILTTTNYGYDFVSAFQKNNIIGVQFHPEKSHRFGMQLLNNYSKL